VLAACLFAGGSASLWAGELPQYRDVEFQPFTAQVRRVVDTLDMLGQPITPTDRLKVEQALVSDDRDGAILAIQTVLDRSCLIGVEINPESRVKAAQGPAQPRLNQNGWSVFLVKVRNDAGITAELAVESPNAAPVYAQSTNVSEPRQTIHKSDIIQRWMDVSMFKDRPLNRSLSGLNLEYRVIQIYSRDAGHREGKLGFNVGQGTQDLGFRSDVDILFDCRPAVTLTLDVRDDDGKPVMASLIFRDGQGRVYPSPSRRLAPDFFFHPQVYRQAGETVELPAGKYEVEYTRGPEYLPQTRSITVPPQKEHRETFTLKRWINLAKEHWYSGDHHVHAAGCGHYESPTAGVRPQDMWRHILGEDLDVGCVLSWGPCWYAQKLFFEGKTNALSTPDHLMRYDVEVSGFPSSHCGHVCLLRLKEDDYPGTSRIEEWPSWDLPVLKWGKAQGGIVGFAHSATGLQTKDQSLPTYEVPKFDSIGANEYIMDVTHDAVDFISAADTPAPHELNIWYHTLNCGYRAKISGETDFPCIYGERVGIGRVYVKLDDGKLDFDRWCEGVKLGRSYVSDGRSHLIDFKVDDRGLGEQGGELKLDAPKTVKVTARVAAYLPAEQTARAKAIQRSRLDQKPYWEVERARIGASRKVPLEVVLNGFPAAKREIVADGTIQEVSFEVPIEKSSWLALRIYPTSHTNPIFVTVAGKPIRASKKSAEWCLKGVDQCWSRKERNIRPAEIDDAKAAYDAARQAYKKIMEEAAED
jgi:hypothetical protein